MSEAIQWRPVDDLLDEVELSETRFKVNRDNPDFFESERQKAIEEGLSDLYEVKLKTK